MTKGHEPLDLALLADFVEGRLDEQQMLAVAASIAESGPRGEAAVAWLHDFVREAQQVPLEDPPPIVRAHLREHFEAWRAARSFDAAAVPREVHTSLIFDSRVDALPLGVRSVEAVDGLVHLGFAGDGADVVLDIANDGIASRRVDGQILLVPPAAESTFEVEIRAADGTLNRTHSDRSGRFSLAGIAPGDIVVRASNGIISVRVHAEIGGL